MQQSDKGRNDKENRKEEKDYEVVLQKINEMDPDELFKKGISNLALSETVFHFPQKTKHASQAAAYLMAATFKRFGDKLNISAE